MLTGLDDTPMSVREHLVASALPDAAINDKIELEPLLELVSKGAAKLRRRPKQAFTFVAGLDVRLPARLTGRRLLGCTYDPATADEVAELAAARNMFESGEWQRIEADGVDLRKLQFLAVRVQGRDLNEALVAGSGAAQLLIAVLNWIAGSGTQVSLGGQQRLARIGLPLVFAVAGSDGSSQCYYGAAPPTLAPSATLDGVSESSRRAVWDILLRFEEYPKPGSSNYRLLCALIQYSGAIQSDQMQEQFLGMWVALEILSNAPNGGTDEVAARISNLWSADGQLTVKPLVSALAGIRNLLVHSGNFEHEYSTPVSELGALLSRAFGRFAHMAKDLPLDADFDYYFASVSLTRTDLDRRARIGKLVLKERARKQQD
jgi:hypothetical protein